MLWNIVLLMFPENIDLSVIESLCGINTRAHSYKQINICDGAKGRSAIQRNDGSSKWGVSREVVLFPPHRMMRGSSQPLTPCVTTGTCWPNLPIGHIAWGLRKEASLADRAFAYNIRSSSTYSTIADRNYSPCEDATWCFCPTRLPAGPSQHHCNVTFPNGCRLFCKRDRATVDELLIGSFSVFHWFSRDMNVSEMWVASLLGIRLL